MYVETLEGSVRAPVRWSG